MVEIYKVKTKEEMNQVYEIRREVFIKEQAVGEEFIMDEFDEQAIHVLSYVDGTAAGCARMLLQGEEAKIGRVAVKKEGRRYGLGTGMCKLLMSIAADRGVRRIYIHAQIKAVQFYLSLGFIEEGEYFPEGGTENVKMVKTLY